MRDGAVHDFVMKTATHLTGDAVIEKFRLNAERVLGKDRCTAAIDLVQRLETLKDVSQLLDAVTTAGTEGITIGIAPVHAGQPAAVAALTVAALALTVAKHWSRFPDLQIQGLSFSNSRELAKPAGREWGESGGTLEMGLSRVSPCCY